MRAISPSRRRAPVRVAVRAVAIARWRAAVHFVELVGVFVDICIVAVTGGGFHEEAASAIGLVVGVAGGVATAWAARFGGSALGAKTGELFIEGGSAIILEEEIEALGSGTLADGVCADGYRGRVCGRRGVHGGKLGPNGLVVWRRGWGKHVAVDRRSGLLSCCSACKVRPDEVRRCE